MNQPRRPATRCAERDLSLCSSLLRYDADARSGAGAAGAGVARNPEFGPVRVRVLQALQNGGPADDPVEETATHSGEIVRKLREALAIMLARRYARAA